MNTRKRAVIAGMGCVGLVSLLAGCGEKLKDAPTGERYDSPVQIIQNADQFSNISTMCVPMVEGKRMFVSSNDQASRPVIIDDENCHLTDPATGQ